MSQFEICKQNYLNTTTLVAVESGASTVDALFDRNSTSQYQSSGLNDDTSGMTMTVEFTSSRNINRIVLQNINLKAFTVYYNSNTANTFTLTSTADTNTSAWAQNSDTSLYLAFSTQACTSIGIVATSTIDANEEKKIGQLWCLEKKMSFERNPDAKSYKPQRERKEYVHEMAGGGWSQYIIDEYFTADIKLKYRSLSETTQFLDVYDDRIPFVFIPFPTSSNWQATEYAQIYECIWQGDYDFLQPSANNFLDVGFSGTVKLRETAK